MSESTPDPIEVVQEVLRRAKYGNDTIDRVVAFLKDNSPQHAEEIAQDHAIRERRRSKFNDRFPDATRLGSGN